MKCNSCSEDISSKFTHAYEANACPACGGALMEPELHTVLKDLKAVMKAGEPYLDQVKDWLASNYSLGVVVQQPISQANNPIDQTNLIMTDQFDEGLLARQTQMAKQQLNGFQQRAGIKPPTPLTNAKALLQKIQGKGGGGGVAYAADPSEFVGEDPDYGHIDMSQELAGPKMDSNEKEAIKDLMDSKYAAQDHQMEQALELEKIRKMHAGGNKGVGKTIRRLED